MSSDLVCNICDGAICNVAFHYERKLGICGKCAKLAAAAYYLSHSGDIPDELRSPDDQAFFGYAAKPLTRGYQKAKIPQELRWKVFRRDSYCCQTCGTHEDLTADHIIPEIDGGQTILENLQTLCRPCNSRKWAHS